MKFHDVKHFGLLTVIAYLICLSVLLTACSGGESASSLEESSSVPASSLAASSEPSSEASSEEISSEPESSSSEASLTEEEPSSSASSSAFYTPPANAVPSTTGVDFSYFNDAVFVGDSVSLKLQYYVQGRRQSDPGYMGTAQFLCSGSLGSGNALWDVSGSSVHPAYQGEKMKIEDAVAKMGAKKVYLMLGMNDVAVYGADGSVNNMKKLLANIKAASPGVSICVQSATPMIRDSYKGLSNELLYDYDVKLAAMCAQNGYYFIDVASVMRDENGRLPASYCSDPDGMGLHFTDAACEVWIEYLCTHTV